VFLFYLCKDKNVIQAHHYNPFSYEGSEDVVHHSLEGGGTVGYSKEHYKRFEEATISAESYLPFISRLDVYVIKTPADVKFCEVPVSAELKDEFRDERERVFVLDS